MPSSEEFDQALDTIAEYVHAIGDEISEENVGSLTVEVRGEEYELTGHTCVGEEDSVYMIAGHPDLEFFYVVYALSVTGNVANQLDESIVDGLLEGQEDLDDTVRKRRAAKMLLERLPRGDMDALKAYTFMFLSSGHNNTLLHSDENGVFEYYTVENQIFPYEDDFSIREVQDAVQSTVTGGRRGNHLLRRTLFIDKDEDDPSESEINLNFGW
ncbi:hypothetical protein BDK88_4316 [Natrinema hispanicum]|uniref:Uncharacterized protein n=1 Tax=Natrinema hispanicum TaxID=392421 RepID=A0A482Y6J5_9EURY|nr:hypothetical protein [Natrinema hispanicum]RZV05077.1 hypothetical protein BDK88_4316 [Natrinema hispanicum]